MTRAGRPLRVLQWIFSLGGGGVENWLLQLMDRLDPDEFRVDVMVHHTGGIREDEVRQRGCGLFECNVQHRRPLSVVRRLRQIMREHGPYDVLHSHVAKSSALGCWAARQEGVPVRIAHSRGASRDFQTSSLLRRLHLQIMRRGMRRHATHLLAISADGARGLFGPGIESNPKYRRVVTAIDLSPFMAAVDVSSVRGEWGIPADAPVIGHVARFSEYKNHRLIVEMANELRETVPAARFLLVGDGPLQEEIERRVAAYDLEDRFIFTGYQESIPELMRAMDLFVFPSKWEGLGRVVVEAQASGLPCLISDAVPPEADVVEELVRRLPVSAGGGEWAETAAALLDQGRSLTRLEALECVRGSEFNMEESARIIADIYREAASIGAGGSEG